MTPVEFREDLWQQKTTVPRLSCGVVYVILHLAVLVEHRLVTDGQTDGHRAMASTADAQHHAVKTKLDTESQVLLYEVMTSNIPDKQSSTKGHVNSKLLRLWLQFSVQYDLYPHDSANAGTNYGSVSVTSRSSIEMA